MSFDAEILQDFLTEAGELLERLESDLVSLENDPADPEMLNQVFRALHTVKGSASFLALGELVKIAHAAESALNAARNRVVTIDRAAMDLLLQAVDIIKTQLGQVRRGEAMTVAPDRLVAALSALGEGKAASAGKPAAERARAEKPEAPQAVVGRTIRVDVGRLESLMNLVGELVLQKNRVAALSRSAAAAGLGKQAHELAEAMTLAANGLDRVTTDIQLAVMRARMQPLEKLFGRYRRLIRDLARKTGKQIELQVEGGETEVDKSVIDELGDPLVHLMRNAADHGLEPPQERSAAGKGPAGTIRLSASQQGDHVRIVVADDGRGLAREKILAKAEERGLVRPEQGRAMTDAQVFDLIFLPGFSTAEQVSDLSGRGVGMDVVRTNIEKIKGSIDLASETGRGTMITITIPLTVAILPAMMVAVADEIYAIPLNNILEIVKPNQHQVSTIGRRPVMRLRGGVLPLVSACEVFDLPADTREATPFTVVLSINDRRLGLMVSRVIGQQEIVIKALDTSDGGPTSRGRGPVSGATVRDDGGVSLIVDVAELMRKAHPDPAGS